MLYFLQVYFSEQLWEPNIMRVMNSLAFLALAIAASGAFAKTPPAPHQPTPQDYARRNQQLEQAALEVADLIDKGQEGQVWDGASSITKHLVRRDAFVKGVGADRKMVGALMTRTLARLSFSESDGKKLPPGLFANVAFATRFANEKQPVRELVSFHLDSDKVWRVTGYTLR